MTNFNVDLVRFAAHVSTATGNDLLADEALLLARDGRLRIQWAPFDYTPSTARLVIVGITPGREQAANALHALSQALHQGYDRDAAMRHAKLVGSFSGSLRANIVRMLDSIGVQQALGVSTCASLFDAAHERVHFTSALRYPVFIDDANYNGSPNLLVSPEF